MLIMDAAGTLDAIHEALDGQELSPDTADAIADCLRHVGYKIRAPR
jgi:hypothetical protein